MPDSYSPEDEAAIYALDGLSPVERRKFEIRLAESAELRALVREIEEGAVALTFTAAPKTPPKTVWQKIEKAVAQKNEARSTMAVIWAGWWRHGWAAAAACLAGWLFYAVSLNRPGPSVAELATLRTAPAEENKAIVRTTVTGLDELGTSSNGAVSNTPAWLQARAREVTVLRRRITELENRTTNLSQAVAEEQALLGEANRLKVFQLSPIMGENEAAAAPSPQMQRALFLAMARQLGWLPPTAATNQSGFEYVDMRPNTESGTVQTAPPPPANSNLVPTIPAFQSDTNIFLAIDPSVAPGGSRVTVSTGDNQSSADVTMGDGTLILTVPASVGASGLAVSVTGNGQSNTYFYAPTNHP